MTEIVKKQMTEIVKKQTIIDNHQSVKYNDM